jgi:multiple sugar transport system permease protein
MALYLPTLIRYCALGTGVILAMLGTYKVLVVLGVKREAATGCSLILPWVLGFLIFKVFPVSASLYLSFTDYNLLQAPDWIGFKNFIYMFTEDYNFWLAIKLTFGYAILTIPLGMAGSLLTAMLLNTDIKGLGAYRTVYYLPSVLPLVSVAMLWRWVFAPSGLINSFLRFLGIQGPPWFGDPDWVLPAFVLMSLWGIAGQNMIIFLSGLKNIARHLYDVASVDGADWWARFWHVTIPQLTPVIFFQLVMGIIAAMQIFVQAYFIRTPVAAGRFMNIYIYQNAFGYLKMGYASALAWILFVIILMLTLLVFKSSAAWVYYEAKRR